MYMDGKCAFISWVRVFPWSLCLTFVCFVRGVNSLPPSLSSLLPSFFLPSVPLLSPAPFFVTCLVTVPRIGGLLLNVEKRPSLCSQWVWILFSAFLRQTWQSELHTNDQAPSGITIPQFTLLTGLHTQHSHTVSSGKRGAVTQIP